MKKQKINLREFINIVKNVKDFWKRLDKIHERYVFEVTNFGKTSSSYLNMVRKECPNYLLGKEETWIKIIGFYTNYIPKWIEEYKQIVENYKKPKKTVQLNLF